MSKHFKHNTHTPTLQWIYLDTFRVQLLAQEHFDMQVTMKPLTAVLFSHVCGNKFVFVYSYCICLKITQIIQFNYCIFVT